MKMSPTTQERLWAVISHLSALGFGMGILLPIVGWSEQRRKSSYASFQCLQALGYQSLGYTLWLLSCLLIGIVLILALAFAAGKTPDNSPGANTIAGIWLIIFMITFFGMFGIYFLL